MQVLHCHLPKDSEAVMFRISTAYCPWAVRRAGHEFCCHCPQAVWR